MLGVLNVQADAKQVAKGHAVTLVMIHARHHRQVMEAVQIVQVDVQNHVRELVLRNAH